ncbi:MAG: glycogen synthase [Myxococcota bacterium]|nr:glycogen synthase [Myxococcota bacterium]
MDILVVTAEIAPYSRSTSAAETCSALPKALRGLGHKVTVLSPLWASIDPGARHLARRLLKIEVEVEGQKRAMPLFEGRSAGGVELAFLAEETLFPRNAAPADEGPETAARWGAFARGTIELIKKRETRPEVVHCVGWQTAILPALMQSDPALASIPTVLTIHDVASKGLYEKSALPVFGLDPSWWRIDGVEFYGKLSTLKTGVQTASRIATPSPSYAREITQSAGGLEGALAARKDTLVGVLDGVDTSVWNSATDPWLEARFDAMDVAGAGTYGKQRCKSAMQKEIGLPVRSDVPLISTLGIVSEASGEGMLADIGAKLLRNDVQLVVIAEPGSDPAIVSRFVQLAARWSDRIAVRHDADQGMVHRVIGASDLVLVPSPHDPSGARAMQAHRYGALPIARRAGGIADAVVDCDAKLVSGTGFLWDEASGEAMLGAMQRAISAFAQAPQFRAMQHRVMTIDHSWDRSARLYDRLYRSAAGPAAPPPREDAGSSASEART